MLLKFTTIDMFNTLLIDVASGERAYEITTVSVHDLPRKPKLASNSFSSSQTAAPSVEFSPVKEFPSTPGKERRNATCRQTQVKDALDNVVADVQWEGRHPHITIDGRRIGGLNDLFGTSSVRFMPKALAIPTKYDPDYVWTATPDCLTLVDYSTSEIKGTFHQNVLRFPSPLKSSKPKPRFSVQTKLPIPSDATPPPSPTSSNSLFKCPSRIFSTTSLSPPSSPVLESPPALKQSVKSAFVPTYVPGFGSNYLEFITHPLTNDVEVILSFLIMEILRRGRFNLTPYTFDDPTIWQLKEARDIVLRRFRRHTV